MLHDGLAGTEGTRNCRHTAGGNGEERINNPLSRYHGRLRRKLFLIGTAAADRPALKHGNVMLLALVVLHHGDHIFQLRRALINLRDCTADAVGHHDLVLHNGAFLHRAQHRTCLNLIALDDLGLEAPLLFAVQAGDLNAAADTLAALIPNDRQRALNAIKDGLDQARSQLHGKRSAGGFHRLPGAKARSLLIDLNGGAVAAQLDDLAHEAVTAHAHHVIHSGVGHVFRDNQGAGNLYNGSLCHGQTPFSSLLNRISAPMAFSTFAFTRRIP